MMRSGEGRVTRMAIEYQLANESNRRIAECRAGTSGMEIQEFGGVPKVVDVHYDGDGGRHIDKIYGQVPPNMERALASWTEDMDAFRNEDDRYWRSVFWDNFLYKAAVYGVMFAICAGTCLGAVSIFSCNSAGQSQTNNAPAQVPDGRKNAPPQNDGAAKAGTGRRVQGGTAYGAPTWHRRHSHRIPEARRMQDARRPYEMIRARARH